MIRSGVLLVALTLWAWPAAAQIGISDAVQNRAEAGDAAAQRDLALAYHRGEGVAQNYAQAATWARRAAEQGDAVAQHLLGQYLFSGLGVPQDRARSLEWLRAAAEQGNPDHLFDLGSALDSDDGGASDPAMAAVAFERAAAQGHVGATVSLGVLAQQGRGIPQDFDRARALFQRGVVAGDARAQNNLGLLFARGHGVEQDYAEAARLFEAAAAQGLRPAMRNLAVMYENALGVPLDEARAVALYRMAAGAEPDPEEGGDPAAAPDLIYDARLGPPTGDAALLRQLAQGGDPVAQFQLAWRLLDAAEPTHADTSAAADLFRAAAQSGMATAMVNIGVLYFQGRGVPQDYVLGYMWLVRANQSGLPAARAALGAYSALPTPSQINQAQTLAQPPGAAKTAGVAQPPKSSEDKTYD